MKRLRHVDHATVVMLPVCACLALLIVAANGHPPRHFCLLRVSDDNNDYHRYDFDEPVPSAAYKPVMVFEKKLATDGMTNDMTRSGINFKKKNSEIISVLMGLRRAMSHHYNERLQGTQ